MNLKAKKILGFTLSIIGLIILIITMIDYLGGYHNFGGDFALFGLVIAAIGMWINNKVLFGKEK